MVSGMDVVYGADEDARGKIKYCVMAVNAICYMSLHKKTFSSSAALVAIKNLHDKDFLTSNESTKFVLTFSSCN